MPKPFIKWAGGKRQLLSALAPLLPKALAEGRIRRYCEPFLGGGALFFHLADSGLGFERSVLCDKNPELTLVYRVVQRKVDALIDELGKLEKTHLRLSPEARKANYLRKREAFNRDRVGFSFERLTTDAVKRASEFLFLNRTGYNGLWRVNQSGAFNVPFGRYRQPRICDAETLGQASSALKRMKAEVKTADFSCIESEWGKTTLVYYDPPYRPVSASANFNTYTAEGFADAQQERLAQFFAAATRKGTWQMLSNSVSEDRFFEKIYGLPGNRLVTVKARRSINSRASARGAVGELVVMNYAE
jgi:DNA adenine methylase